MSSNISAMEFMPLAATPTPKGLKELRLVDINQVKRILLRPDGLIEGLYLEPFASAFRIWFWAESFKASNSNKKLLFKVSLPLDRNPLAFKRLNSSLTRWVIFFKAEAEGYWQALGSNTGFKVLLQESVSADNPSEIWQVSGEGLLQESAIITNQAAQSLLGGEVVLSSSSVSGPVPQETGTTLEIEGNWLSTIETLSWNEEKRPFQIHEDILRFWVPPGPPTSPLPLKLSTNKGAKTSDLFIQRN